MDVKIFIIHYSVMGDLFHWNSHIKVTLNLNGATRVDIRLSFHHWTFAFMVLQDKLNGPAEECCSFTSSNRESWGRCSSLGGSDVESYADYSVDNNFPQVSLSLSLSTHKFELGTVHVRTSNKSYWICITLLIHN